MNKFVKDNSVALIIALCGALFTLATLVFNAGGRSAELTQVKDDCKEIKQDVKELRNRFDSLQLEGKTRVASY